MRSIRRPASLVALAALTLLSPGRAGVAAQTGDQSVLGPGLYVFQTRTRSATCDDDERTGYVSSFVAAVQGVPGQPLDAHAARQLAVLEHLDAADRRAEPRHRRVHAGRRLGAERPRNRFEIRVDRDRFTGTGTRT
ncbi:MAG: hypothetical protein M5U28_17825 [Sandaracinaceae bacterium]|nr:hypothetical protein [Sandaracinaceae bacterium]